MRKRETKCLGIRIDARIIDQLDVLADNEKRTRNWLIEQILGRESGLETYDWRKEDALEPPELRDDND